MHLDVRFSVYSMRSNRIHNISQSAIAYIMPAVCSHLIFCTINRINGESVIYNGTCRSVLAASYDNYSRLVLSLYIEGSRHKGSKCVFVCPRNNSSVSIIFAHYHHCHRPSVALSSVRGYDSTHSTYPIVINFETVCLITVMKL